MAKRRKRTNKDVPAKGVLRDHCDKLWSLAVRTDWGNRCAVCGSYGKLDAHHLIPRQHQAMRYVLKNGMALCFTHHRKCPDVSPHQNADGWKLWLGSHYPEIDQWVRGIQESGDHHNFNGTTNAWYYIDVIGTLKEYVSDDDYVRIVGKKFSRYLEDLEQ